MATGIAISDGERALGTRSRAASRAPNRPAPTPRACHDAAVAGRQPDLTPPCRCSPSLPRIRVISRAWEADLRAPRAMLDGAAHRPRPRAPPASKARQRRCLSPHWRAFHATVVLSSLPLLSGEEREREERNEP